MKRLNVFATALTLLVGIALGGIMATTAVLEAQKAKEDRLYVVDKHGKSVHLGDVIKVDGFKAPIKVRGWTSVDKAGTTSGYEYQIELCPTCKWVETYPPSSGKQQHAMLEQLPHQNRSLLVRFLELYEPAVIAQDDNGDGRSIIWGS